MNLLKIIFLLSIFALSLTNINDSDAFTHLSLGREIIKNLGFPLTEPFTHTSLGKPFACSEWLFGVVFYGIFALSGSAGVVILKAGIITLTYFILFKDSELRTMSLRAEFSIGSDKSDPCKNCRGLIYQAPYLIAVTTIFLIALFSRDRFVERPEILSNLFLVFTIFSLNQFFYNGRRYIYFIPIVFILWANTHPSIIIGLYPFIAFIIGGFIQRFFNKPYPSPPIDTFKGGPQPSPARGAGGKWNKLAVISLILFISILCILINPYTYNILFVPKGLTANIWRYEVVELAPPDWQGYKFLYIFIGVIFISFLFNLRQSIIYIILILPFITLSTSAIRFIPLLGIVGGPIVARNISHLKFDPESSSGSNFKFLLLKIFAAISIVILTIATLANTGPFKNYENTFGISIDASLLPDGASEYLDKNNIQGRLFNTFHFGGYITFKEHPKRLTFIDGRGGAALPDYLNALASQQNWDEIEKKYGVDIAILEYPKLPAALFDIEKDFGFPFKGWTLVYWDTASLVYLKNDAFKDIAERDGYRHIKPANGSGQFSKGLYNKEYREGVINELERNIKTNPNPRAYILLGFAYNEIGEFDRAIESLNKVFEYKNVRFLFSFAHNGLGFSYIKKRGFKMALYHFKKSLGYVEDPDILYNLGLVYSQMNDHRDAVYYFKKAVAVKGNYLPAYISLIGAYKKLGFEKELAEIEAVYKQKLNASQSEGHFNIALRLYINGKLDDALEEFKKSIEINPYSPASHTNLGFIYYDKKNLDAARREFVTAIEIDKNWADAHYGLAIVYKKLGDNINAKKEFEEYLKINPRGFWARKAREEIGSL